MSLITVSNLGKSYGPDDIFSGISLAVPRRARIGLVGPNGVGKTTLLRILAGEESPSEGQLHRARATRLAYLPQQADFRTGSSLWEVCLAVFSELRAQEAILASLEADMADPSRREEALGRYGPAQEAFERQGGYTYTARIGQTLGGLGFDRKDFKRPVSQLSGGQRTRALLARMLLSDPDLLILDEPTNHLDVEAVEWLEKVFRDWPGAVVMVSHDRYFLDAVVHTIWEMTPLGFEVYRGNYSAYTRERELRHAHRLELFEREIARMENELDYIRRNLAGQRTTQAKGKLRRLSREIEALEKGGLLAVHGKRWGEISAELDVSGRVLKAEEAAARIKSLRAPVRSFPQVKIRLEAASRSGDLVLRTRALVVGYQDDGKPLFEVPDLIYQRGECAALIGPNGVGKTTFLKTLLGLIPPLDGEIILGASLRVGYFAQANEALDPDLTLMEELRKAAPRMLDSEAHAYLARFLFTGDDVFKPVAVLSGGERSRLALAKLALTDANLLLLDEPTNHLDIPSQEVLQTVLSSYQGTILLVSHDRYLIDALGTQIWEIEARGALMTVFEGGYSAYRAFQAEQAVSDEDGVEKTSGDEERGRGWESGEGEPKKPSAWELRQQEARRLALEKDIETLEKRQARLSAQLADPPGDPAEIRRLGEAYVQNQEALDKLLAQWETLHS